MKYSYIILFLLFSGIIAFVTIFSLRKSRTLKELPGKYYIEKKINLELPEIEKGKKISKVFHRTHETEEIISLFQDVEDKIKKSNPNFKVINYTEEDRIRFIKKYYNKRIFKAYQSIKSDYGNSKADFFKFLLLYVKGGIYLDIKSGPDKNINNMIDEAEDKMIVSSNSPIFGWHWEVLFPYGENILWALIAPKGHPVMKQLIKQSVIHIENDYKEKNFFGNKGAICLAGPIMYTIITNKKENRKHIKYLSYQYDRKIKKFLTNYVEKRKKISSMGVKHYTYLKSSIVEEYKGG